ncbi:hypothetical protein D3C78_1519570 [compost metagenome]
MAMPPKLLMASTMRRMPRRRHSAATSSSGLSMPVVVSQCTMARWVISGCRPSRDSMAATSGRAVSPQSSSR